MKKTLVVTTVLSLSHQLHARALTGKTNFEIVADIYMFILLGILGLLVTILLLFIVGCMEAETKTDHRREEAEKKKKRDDSL